MTGQTENPGSGDLPWHISVDKYVELLERMRSATLRMEPFPDSVIGDKRSGLFPAVYLSHQFKLPMFTAQEARSFPFPKFKHPLLVDTTAWSGATLRQIVRRVEKCGVESVNVLVMFVRPGTPPDVDRLHYLEVSERIPRFWYDEEYIPDNNK